MTNHLPPSPAPVWCPPGRSLSTRNVHARSRGASRPSLVGGAQPREIMCESGLEKKAGHFLLTHPQVADLREQPPAVKWIDASGIEHRYTFDFLVTLHGGWTIAVAVKPLAKAERQRLKETLAVIAGQLAPGFADGVLLITDADLPRDVVHNSALLHHARRGADDTHDTVVEELLALAGTSTIGGLVAASGLGGAGFRAIVRLIARGTIEVVGNARIGYDTFIAWSAPVNQEAAQ